MAKNYLDLLLQSKRYEAISLIIDSVEENVISVENVYIHVFQQVQYEIGRLWQEGGISIAQEHFCSAVTQQCMSQLYPKIFSNKKHGGKAVFVCAQGELHEIGARMVADLLEMNGWDSFYLGANTPTESIVDYVTDIKPNLVGISATITAHIPRVKEIITKLRALPGGDLLYIIVGGYPFRIEPSLWEKVGANATSSNAQTAIQLADQVIGNR